MDASRKLHPLFFLGPQNFLSQTAGGTCLVYVVHSRWCNRRDGVVVRASASQSVDLGFIFPCRVIPKDFKKMVFTASLLGAQQIRDSVENKPASLLVVSLGKALNGTPPSLCGRQMVGPSSLPVVVAQSDERHANRA